jgi:hypothetical protein
MSLTAAIIETTRSALVVKAIMELDEWFGPEGKFASSAN